MLAKLAPGPPALEHAVTLGALSFVGADVAEWPGQPARALLPESEWPGPLPRARVNVQSRADWVELAAHLVDLGIFAA